jgi:hypothetical protein
MKTIYTLLLITTHVIAQVPINTAGKSLDKNRIKANINTVNNKFWTPYSSGGASYEAPKGTSRHSQFANSMWIGGFDHQGKLHVSANTYMQMGTDFAGGPLDTANITALSLTNTAAYNKLWKVDCNDINNFVTAFNNGSVTANTYTIPDGILNYPAKGIGKFQKNLHPFMDVNGDGLYDPYHHGDYPIIRGQQQILSIYNDVLNGHTETQSRSMGIEIHEKSYAYYDAAVPDSMQAINFTTFYHYTIYNRSDTAYTNVYISDWSDVDLGYYLDDYIGTDTLNNFTYCYNGTNNDITAMGIYGYGTKPPVVSHALLKTNCLTDGIDNDGDLLTDEADEQFNMNRSTYYNNNIGSFPPATTNPQGSATHYYNYMSGYWKNGTPFTYGGNAYNGTVTTHFVYPGDPSAGTGWTEATANNVAGDRRVITSSGPFSFPAKSKIEWGFAVVFSQDTSQAVNTITQFNTRVKRDVRNVRLYDQQHQGPLCTPAITTGLMQNRSPGIDISVYPNPVKDKAEVTLARTFERAELSLYDISGRLIMKEEIKDTNKATLDLSDLAPGTYLLEVTDGASRVSTKLVK